MLNAISLALTGAPVVKLNGDDLSTEAGIEHVLLEMTEELLMPSQLVVSYNQLFEEDSI